MALLNTWASQQDQATLSPLSRLLNNYIQKGDAPLAYLMRGDAQGLLKDLNTPKPVNMTQDMTNAALNLNPVMGLIGATAFHGSPYLFNKFDPTKVGSGVGKNAFGQGTYFSESQDVAKEYLAPKANSAVSNFLYKDKPIDPNNDMQRSAAFALNYFNGDKAKILDMYKPSYFQSSSGKQFKKYIDNMDIADIKPAGNLYKVDIPDEYIPKMIEWDKPIKDQPEVFNLIKSNIKDDDILKSFENNAKSGITGSNAYSNYISGKTDAEKSRNALQLGIKGIKYLDEGSSKTGKGINNFVVFDPSNVNILERNNKGLLK
jgi:hypothetical protein